MTPSARTQAAIELLDQIIAGARDSGAAADTLIARYFSTRRYAGSKDRRAVRELVYAAIRAAGERPASGRAAMLAVAEADPEVAATFDGVGHGPAPIGKHETAAPSGVAPTWIIDRLHSSDLGYEEFEALISRAPLDARINRMIVEEIDIEGAEPIAGLPDGLRLPSGTQVENLPAYNHGAIEVQDAGSQFVTLAAKAKPGQRIVDLCAGAGGKTLALAAVMEGQGEVLATDTDRMRLSRMAPRAERARSGIIETRLLNPGREVEMLDDWLHSADCVLIDAPCSGTGTWRRNPEARWRLTPDRIERLVKTQKHVLEVGANLVKPGGALVYIVCSLLDEEGAGQVADFLTANPGWKAQPLKLPVGRKHGPGVRLTPAHDATDGFFVARLIAP
ncbi:RsmB/NOP family class I SAM-dependent RNA methyltransferase [Sphingomonas sp. AAP5]|uniref:RsmB/NOP family class I SAM-dependent RNA methyltransferase n=1 Tax=Sphingomonas sp. AAP5 TaxID=1523415 RepID=UPI0010574C18|nr:RsmB/NOP family class I SAM-dependent RNA methyltransferase [Sphingomonas sp. AAP5]QBM75361.1 RsmB/NOP family class I SAM-dependent RNA methyltransferase [Sphingomonas sp. AAP5]